jgi:hypothetical protein
MNALPSFDPPKQSRSPQARAVMSPMSRANVDPSRSTPRTRVKSNPAYAHRRQGLEVVTKLVTYSTLSIFGAITLVNSVGYNYSQRSKLHHLETELQDAKIRTEKVNSNFVRSFDPQAEQSVMQENSYKVAPDRLQIFLVHPTPIQPVSSKPQTK